DGVKQRRLGLPYGIGIAPGLAWSPDGRMIATTPWTGTFLGGSIGFADADGHPLADPAPLTGRSLLGWRSPRSIVTLAYDHPGDNRESGTIEEIDVTTGRATALSRVEHGHACTAF